MPADQDGRIPSGGGPLAFVADLGDPVLDRDDHHHLARVRRVRDGDPIVVADGSGRWAPARMRGDRPEVDGAPTTARRPDPPIGVGFGLTKGAKPEWCVQKLTELGVDRIVPFVAARSIVRWDDAKVDAAAGRFAKVAREAAMQSRTPWVPTVEPIAPFDVAIRSAGACLADRGGAPPTLAHPVVLIGPEGGWDDAERVGDVPVVSLGTGVLRAETAVVTAGVLLTALREGLVEPRRA